MHIYIGLVQWYQTFGCHETYLKNLFTKIKYKKYVHLNIFLWCVCAQLIPYRQKNRKQSPRVTPELTNEMFDVYMECKIKTFITSIQLFTKCTFNYLNFLSTKISFNLCFMQ